jgi:hypothetical protein
MMIAIAVIIFSFKHNSDLRIGTLHYQLTSFQAQPFSDTDISRRACIDVRLKLDRRLSTI